MRGPKGGSMRTKILALAACAALLAAAPRPPKAVDVALDTSAGTIVFRLDTAKAPRTCANFLRYVDAHAYDGASFYRTVRAVFGRPVPRIQVLQGGLGQTPGKQTFPPIPVESTTASGLHNVAGTVAMARTTEPDSATAEFFVNMADDRWLDGDQFADHRGYAVFARVVRGRDVVAKIHGAPADGESLTPPVKILRAHRI